jgi:hypothetical protein
MAPIRFPDGSIQSPDPLAVVAASSRVLAGRPSGKASATGTGLGAGSRPVALDALFQQGIALQFRLDVGDRSRLDICRSLIACISCGVMIRDWL